MSPSIQLLIVLKQADINARKRLTIVIIQFYRLKNVAYITGPESTTTATIETLRAKISTLSKIPIVKCICGIEGRTWRKILSEISIEIK